MTNVETIEQAVSQHGYDVRRSEVHPGYWVVFERDGHHVATLTARQCWEWIARLSEPARHVYEEYVAFCQSGAT